MFYHNMARIVRGVILPLKKPIVNVILKIDIGTV